MFIYYLEHGSLV